MAEVIGIAAATVQFLDVGARLLGVLSQVCADLRHVPRKVEAAVEELTEFILLVRMLDSDIRAPNTGPGSTLNGALSPAKIAYATRLLKQCTTQAQQLEGLLQPLVPKPGGHALRKGWRAVVGLKAEEEILERWTRLQGVKASLGLWYNHETLLLLNDQALTSERIECGMKQLDQKLTPFGAQLQTLRDNSEASNDAIKSMLHRTELGMGKLGQQYGSLAGNLTSFEMITRATYDNVEVLNQESRSVHARLSRIEDAVSALKRGDELLQNVSVAISQDDCDRLSNQICQRIASRPQLAANVFADEVPEPTSSAEGYALVSWKSRSQSSVPCTCTVRRSRWQLAWPLTLIHYDSREQHQRGCPWSWRSRSRWSLGVRFLLPRLLAKSLHVTFSATYGAGGCTLTPNFTSVRIVDRKTSPAFRAIDTARREMYSSSAFPKIVQRSASSIGASHPICHLSEQERISIARSALEKVWSELQSLFCAGKASPCDQDLTGFTLLHDFVSLSICVVEFQNYLSDQISGIIDMLVGGGVNPGATYKSGRTELVNALELTFKLLMGCIPHSLLKRSFESLRLASILTHHGCEAVQESVIVNSLAAEPAVHWGTNIFLMYPDVALDCGYSQLCLAVIQRSETELRRLIQRGQNVQREPGRRYSPLSLAIGWTVGIQILLEAGADPFPATLHAIGRGDEASLGILLTKCPMFKPRGSRLIHKWMIHLSLLSAALQVKSSWTVMHLIVERLAEDLHQLADLAWKNLSHHHLRRLGLNQKDKGIISLHGKELSITEALSKNGIEIPVRLQCCPYVTVYHDEDMDVHTADELWARGFRAIDIPDAWGCTPLLIACTRGGNEMIRWYIDKGAAAVGFPKVGIRSCLHTFAVSCRFHKLFSHYQEALERLNQVCVPTLTDTCTCYCSSDGCLPVNLVFKRQKMEGRKGGWQEKTQSSCEWLDLGRINSGEQEACYSELCRLEIFERLGMAHTCCRPGIIRPEGTGYEIPSVSHMAEEEQSELRDEDEHGGLVQELQAYMQLYEALRMEYPEQISVFWTAWWRTLADVLPERRWVWDGNYWRDVTDGRVEDKDRSEADNEEDSTDAEYGTGLDEDCNGPDDTVSDGSSQGCRVDENMIRSRMEFFLGGGAIALVGDVFSEEESGNEDSGSEDSGEWDSVEWDSDDD